MTLTSTIPSAAPDAPDALDAPAADDVLAGLGLPALATVSLGEVLGAADLQTRVDRKYLVDVGTAGRLVDDLRGSHRVLSIAGRRATTYASRYFDTDDRRAFRAHAQGRRLRWKVRTRHYVEDGLVRLELKTKARGSTVKDALDVDPGVFTTLGPQARAFLDAAAATRAVDLDVDALRPSVRIDYVRATLCDPAEGTRLTIDGGLVARQAGRAVALRPDLVLVETKGTRRAGGADLLLRSYGVRPASVSKYGVALTLLEPELPGHRWRRLARRHFLLSGR